MLGGARHRAERRQRHFTQPLAGSAQAVLVDPRSHAARVRESLAINAGAAAAILMTLRPGESRKGK